MGWPKYGKAKQKYKCVSGIGLIILGWVGTYVFISFIFFLEKIYNFMHFERHLAFQNA